jgi:phosphatidate cytidylyltransferase
VTDKNKNLLVRILSALILLPLVLYLLYRGSWFTAILLCWGAASSTGEYCNITLKGMPGIAWLAVAGAGLMPFMVVWRPFEAAALVGGIFGVVLLASWLWHLIRGPIVDAPTRVAHLMTAVVYGGGGMTALMAVRQLPDGGWWVVCALVVTWMNDTAAYFSGRLRGKHKLYEAVSPKKTMEGAVGGLAAAVLGGGVAAHFLYLRSLPLLDGIVLSVVAGALGQAGDLGESLLKRSVGVKDSGGIVPGHGGILDRVDALLVTGTLTYLYVIWVRGV